MDTTKLVVFADRAYNAPRKQDVIAVIEEALRAEGEAIALIADGHAANYMEASQNLRKAQRSTTAEADAERDDSAARALHHLATVIRSRNRP